MKEYALAAFLYLFVAGIVLYFVYSVYILCKEYSAIMIAVSRMDVLEKNMFKMGVLLFFFVPILESSPHADLYLFKVLIDILPALAGAFFVAGVISFMKQLRKHRANV